jgi:hypothetical protein
MDWYVSRDGEREGPFTSEQIRVLAETGDLKPHFLVWRTGMEQWTSAQEVPGLLTPPPLKHPHVHVPVSESRPSSIPEQTQSDADQLLEPELTQVNPSSARGLLLSVRNGEFSIWLIVLLLGLYAAVLIPPFAGIGPDTRNGTTFMLVSGLVFAYMWKRSKRNGWIGLLIGMGIAILVAGIAGGIVGFLEGKKSGRDNWKLNFIQSCTGGDETKKSICTCIAEKSNPNDSVQHIKDNIVPGCTMK